MMKKLFRAAGLSAVAGAALAAATALATSLSCPTCQFERVAQCDAFLEGPTIDEAGQLRVVDVISGDILEVKDGACKKIANSGGSANGARFDADGQLYIGDARLGVFRLMDDGSFETVYAAEQGDIQLGANDLVFDHQGGLYFTVPRDSNYSNRNGEVYYVPPGGKAELFRSNLSFPNGIAVTPDGRFVLVGQFFDKSILSLPAVGNEDPVKGDYVLLRTDGGIGPDGMIIDSAERLIWLNFDGRSIGFGTLDGTVLGNLPLPPEAGPMVTNIVEGKDGYYITEGSKGEVWKLTGLKLP